jgi:hypothetical protein
MLEGAWVNLATSGKNPYGWPSAYSRLTPDGQPAILEPPSGLAAAKDNRSGVGSSGIPLACCFTNTFVSGQSSSSSSGLARRMPIRVAANRSQSTTRVKTL